MANDKDFLLKNAVEVGGPTKVTLGSITSGDIDLSTGNYFADTPSGTSTYTISNAGDVQSFQLEVTGGTAEVAQNFSTTLYTGTGAEQTITNDIDLAGDGGLVWGKVRDITDGHYLVDSERGKGTNNNFKYLRSDTAAQELDLPSRSLSSFNSDGFTFQAGDSQFNASGNEYASWTFKKEPSFFDVVTYTGSGSETPVSHSLGSVPGMVIIKRTDDAGDWYVGHRGTGSYYLSSQLVLNSTAAGTANGVFGATFTSTQITPAGNADISGASYVMYLFAHDDAADGLIQCGSYTGTGADNPVTLGWSPQWLMVKRSNAAASWEIMDTTRGMVSGQLVMLEANTNAAEVDTATANSIGTTSTGFTVGGAGNSSNASGSTYIYMAIRAASDPDITWPSSIEWAGGIAPSAPATGETDVFTLSTDDGGTSYVGVKTADNLS